MEFKISKTLLYKNMRRWTNYFLIISPNLKRQSEILANLFFRKGVTFLLWLILSFRLPSAPQFQFPFVPLRHRFFVPSLH